MNVQNESVTVEKVVDSFLNSACSSLSKRSRFKDKNAKLQTINNYDRLASDKNIALFLLHSFDHKL